MNNKIIISVLMGMLLISTLFVNGCTTGFEDSLGKDYSKLEQVCVNQCTLSNMSYYDYSFSSNLAPRSCLCKDSDGLIKQLYSE